MPLLPVKSLDRASNISSNARCHNCQRSAVLRKPTLANLVSGRNGKMCLSNSSHDVSRKVMIGGNSQYPSRNQKPRSIAKLSELLSHSRQLDEEL